MTNRTIKAVAKWRGHIESQQSSGLSQAAYCRLHGLCPRDFRRWRNERIPSLVSGDARLELREVSLPSPLSPGTSGVSVEAGRFLVHVSPSFDRGALAAVLEVLGGLPC